MRMSFKFACVCVIVFCLIISLAVAGSKTTTILAAQAPLEARTCVIIDAGHGGIDGGATSCTGLLESQLNLEIAVKLNDLLHLIGISTKMIRTDDRSVYTSGETIAAKKVSDLKERVRIVNSCRNAVLISIHQNYFADSQYHGAQVFYSQTDDSKALADRMQSALKTHIDPGNNRNTKKASSIYLLEHINNTGILIECGFISNPTEEAKLQDPGYQQELCCVMGSVMSTFLSGT